MRANNGISINGSTANNNAYLIDGLYNRQLWVNGVVMNPPVDAIQETRIMGTDYSAQYGNSAGAVTVVVTRSGTNEIHGSAFEFLRNSDLDANTFFSNRAGTPKPVFRRNEFGGTIGGPIRKDKTFIFGDYQGIRIQQPTTQTVTIPSLAQQQMVETGDFSGLGTTIYNPYSVVNGQRQPFPGNQIPINLLDPAAVKTMQLMPVPTSTARSGNFTFNPTGTQRDDQFDIRGDQNLRSGDRLFVRYSYDNAVGVGAGTLPVGPNRGNVDIGQYLTGGGPSLVKNWSLTVNYTSLLGPTMVNELHTGVLRNYLDIINDDGTHATAASLGIPNMNISDLNLGIPNLTISGFQAIGNNNSYPEFTRSVSLPLEDVLTKVHGNHTLKFGGGYTRHRFDGHTSIAPRGQYTFTGAFTRQVGSTSSASALADFALGASPNITRSEQFGAFGLRMWDASAFAEDAWRVSSRLTVTLGLRYELQAPPYEVYNRYSNLSPVTGTFAVAGTSTQNLNGDCGRQLICLDKNNFAPRIGIAQTLTSDGKTVLRAGFGMSYFEANNGGRMLHSNPPMNVVQPFSTDLNGAPGFLLSQGLPLPVSPNLQDPTKLDGLYEAFDPNMKLNDSLQFHVGVQREIISNTLLEVAFVRTLTEHMTNATVANQAIPGPGPLNPRRPLYGINPVIADIDYRTNYGMAKYNSMQVKATRRYAKGLTASLAWTWSHNVADTNGANSSTRPQNSNCFACEFGNVAEDRRHMVVINHVYELPFGAGRRYLGKGILSQIVGNWTVSGIWTMYTGLHFSPSLASSVSNALATAAIAPTERPNLNGTPNLPTAQRDINHWFNVAAFTIPAQYTFGNAGVGILEGPGYFNLDTNVSRKFPISESKALSFRWEMFNAMNRANFQNPNASIGSVSAGVISGTYPARIMQLALRLTF
jgi:hypothetical protein